MNLDGPSLSFGNCIIFRNELRLQADQFNNTLDAERNNASAEKISLLKTIEELTALKTQVEYAKDENFKYFSVFTGPDRAT